MKSSTLLAIGISLVALLWIGSGFIIPSKDKADSNVSQEQAEDKTAPILKVRVRDSKAEVFTNQVVVTGRTEASREIILKSEVEGTISEIFLQKGDRVEEGEQLALISVNNREALLKEAQDRVKQRSLEYQAAKKLTQKGFNSQVRLAEAKADLKEAKSRLEQAQIDVGNLRLIAPFDAVIFDHHIEVGDYVGVAQDTFHLVDLNPLHLTAFVTESDLKGLKIGAVAYAKLLSGKELHGAVSYIAQRADDQTRTFRIEINVDNVDYEFAAGMTGRIIIPTEQSMAHKISPSVLVLDDLGKIGLKIVDDQNIVQFVPVAVLQDTLDFMWVSGLPEQARIITVGQDFIGAGQEVEVSVSTGDGLL